MITKTKRVAGEFRGTCKLARWVPAAEVPQGWDLDAFTSRWDHKLGCGVFLVPCALDTDDRAAFAEHMTRCHNGGIYRWDSGTLDPNRVAEVRSWKPKMAIPVRMWKPGRLTAEGVPFAPSGTDLGAEVIWHQAGGVRSGQVWSVGRAPKSIWVIPDDVRAEAHPERPVHRLERAVLLRIERDGSLSIHAAETVWSAWADVAA